MRHIISCIFIILGILSATLGIKGFLLPNHLIDGGVTGLSMLLSTVFDLPLPILLILVNIPFILIGFYMMSWQIPLTGIFSILGLGLSIYLIPIAAVTTEPLLAAIFGGVFLGAGIGFAIRYSSVLDGTEILAILLNQRLHISIGDVIMCFNTVLFISSAYFLGFEIAMYSIISYFSASKAIDFLVTGLDEHISMMIVTEKSSEIKSFLLEEFQKGVTILKAQGGFSEKEQNVLFCVMTRFDLSKIKPAILKEDPRAFIITHRIGFSMGGIIKHKSH